MSNEDFIQGRELAEGECCVAVRDNASEANNVRFKTPAQCRAEASRMPAEELAGYVKNVWSDGLRKLVQLKPYIEVLWERFDTLAETDAIAGCRTKTEFCEKRLNRSIRAVQYMLYGRTASTAKDGGRNIALTSEQQEVAEALQSQGYKRAEAIRLARLAEGATFEERFKSALARPTIPQLSGRTESVLDGRGRYEQTDDFVDDAAEPEIEEPEQGVAGYATSLDGEVSAEVPDSSETSEEPELSTLDVLRQRLSQMADTTEIAAEIKEFFEELVKLLLKQHPYTPWAEIKVFVHRKNQYGRIAVGDWLSYAGTVGRLREQVGQDNALGRVIGEDKAGRPKVRWYSEGQQAWSKPYSLIVPCISDTVLRVLFPNQASEQYPEAFACYPEDVRAGEPPRKSVTPERDLGELPEADTDGQGAA